MTGAKQRRNHQLRVRVVDYMTRIRHGKGKGLYRKLWRHLEALAHPQRKYPQ